jgi:hypothetical protein
MGWANLSEWKRDKERRLAAAPSLARPVSPAAGSVSVYNMQEHRARMQESDRVIAASRAQRERERLMFRAAGGANLTAYDGSGRVVRDISPAWTEYVAQERAAGRLPQRSIVERARAAGQPIRDAGDWKRRKNLFRGDDPAA